MEADDVNLTDSEVRERFSAYHDGELPEVEASIVRKRLGSDKNLAAEYDAFAKVLGSLAEMSVDAGTTPDSPSNASADDVDLLRGIQRRLHDRSGGKFYRSRWSRQAGVFPLEIIALVVLVLLGLVYVSLTYISGLRPAESRPQTTQRTR